MMKDKEWYYDTSHPFHVVSGTGEGGVSLLIRKNFIVWIFRLFVYFETSRFVVDGRGRVIVFNHIELLASVIDRLHKVHAQYSSNEYDAPEWSNEKYNDAWDGRLYISSTFPWDDRFKTPYNFWVYHYKVHFQLETPFGRRKHYAYYRPVN